jgi:hypothetical protein
VLQGLGRQGGRHRYQLTSKQPEYNYLKSVAPIGNALLSWSWSSNAAQLRHIEEEIRREEEAARQAARQETRQRAAQETQAKTAYYSLRHVERERLLGQVRLYPPPPPGASSKRLLPPEGRVRVWPGSQHRLQDRTYT